MNPFDELLSNVLVIGKRVFVKDIKQYGTIEGKKNGAIQITLDNDEVIHRLDIHADSCLKIIS